MKFKLFSEIYFNQNIDKYSICKGDIGTLADYFQSNDYYKPDGYCTEVFNAIVYAENVVPVDETKISYINQNSVLSVSDVEFA